MSSRERDGGGWWTTSDIALLGLLARMAVLVYAPAEPVWDGHYYDFGARQIAAGRGYGEDLVIAAADGSERVVWHAWAHYPVGYPGLLAGFYRVFGSGPLVAPMVNVLTGALLAALVHRLARAAFGPGFRSTLAGLLVALHPGLVIYVGALMTEPLAAALVLGVVWLSCVEEAGRPRSPRPGPSVGWLRLSAAGLLLGAATLVRPNVLLMGAALAPIVPFEGWGRASSRAKRAWAWLTRVVVAGAVLIAGAMAVVAPWTLRNCRQMDACALVSTNAGWNLVIGAARGATGKFEFLVGHTPEGGPTCDEGGEVAQDRCWMHYGLQLIRSEPGRWLGLMPAKLHHTLDGEWAPINYLREARPDKVDVALHIRWGKALTGLHHLLVLLAAVAAVGWPRGTKPSALTAQVAVLAVVLGVAVAGWLHPSPRIWAVGVLACALPLVPLPGAPRRTPAELGVALHVLTTLFAHAVFFGEDRYHLVATPAFVLLAVGVGRGSEYGRGPLCSGNAAYQRSHPGPLERAHLCVDNERKVGVS